MDFFAAKQFGASHWHGTRMEARQAAAGATQHMAAADQALRASREAAGLAMGVSKRDIRIPYLPFKSARLASAGASMEMARHERVRATNELGAVERLRAANQLAPIAGLGPNLAGHMRLGRQTRLLLHCLKQG